MENLSRGLQQDPNTGHMKTVKKLCPVFEWLGFWQPSNGLQPFKSVNTKVSDLRL
jgi:hypothetical protein